MPLQRPLRASFLDLPGRLLQVPHFSPARLTTASRLGTRPVQRPGENGLCDCLCWTMLGQR